MTTTGTIIKDSLLDKISKSVQEQGVVGLVVAAVRGDEEQIQCWGRRNENEPYDEDTIFAIGSISKFHAVLCVAVLIEKGIKVPNGTPLTWKTKVQDIVPWWSVGDYGDKVTLEDLSGMRIGLPIHLGSRKEVDVESALRKQRHLRTAYELRETFAYNNEAIYLLGHIVTLLSGVPYPDFLQTEVFDALGMESSSLHSKRLVATGRTCDGYQRYARTGSKPESVGWWTKGDGDWLYSGGIGISARDGIKMAKELLAPKVLPNAAADSIRQSLSLIPEGQFVMVGLDAPRRTYGGGMEHTSYKGHEVHVHTGTQHGQISAFLLVPDLQFGLWIAMNDPPKRALLDAVVLDILDHIMRKDGEHLEKFKEATPAARPPPPALPTMEITSQAVPHSQLVGAYYDKGYGSFNIGVTHEYDEELGFAPCFVAHVGGIFVHKVAFQHFEGLVYKWTAFSTYPSPQPSGPALIAPLNSGRAVFVVGTRAGVGMFDGWWDLTGARKIAASETDVEERAETWFDKVDVL